MLNWNKEKTLHKSHFTNENSPDDSLLCNTGSSFRLMKIKKRIKKNPQTNNDLLLTNKHRQ